MAEGNDRPTDEIDPTWHIETQAIRAGRSFSRDSRRATSASSWPCRANTRASSAPMPADAPVMTATLPSNRRLMPPSYQRPDTLSNRRLTRNP